MRHFLIALLCANLGACAFAPKTTDNRFAGLDDRIATDTVNQLARLYPPAKTQFSLVVSDPAGFGGLLADKLRARGYALTETAEKTPLIPPNTFGGMFSPKPAGADDMPAKPSARQGGISLRYVLDHSGKDYSRISMVIGGAVLARAYLIDHGALSAAGAWTFKE